jgi:hypothetical protein
VLAGNLSGSEQQILKMAIVLARSPRLLRLDKPSLVSRRQTNSGCSAALRDISARRHPCWWWSKTRHPRSPSPTGRSVLALGRKFLERPAAEGLNSPSAKPISARGRFVNASLIIPDQLMTTVWPMLIADAHRAIAC